MMVFTGSVLANFHYATIITLLANYGITIPWYIIPLVSVLIAGIISLFFCEEVIENEKIKHDFVTIVTHKFRTPITGMKWALDNLKDNSLTQQERIDVVRRMEQSTERLLEIVDLMVGASQFDRRIGYMHELASIREMVESSLQKYAEFIRSKNITLQIDPGNNIPKIIIDKRKLQFALDVLIENAIKYTPAGGKVAINFIQNNKTVILKIQDTGIGFGFFERKRIFKEFYRAPAAKTIDTEGMGLGLFTAKTIVEAHGGKLWATSKGKNRGATFYMELKTEL
jgi:two-component system sensor histidine kinase VicK